MLTRRHCRMGFTLIELLVWIAIILILAGILYPFFVEGKHHYRVSRCLETLRPSEVHNNTAPTPTSSQAPAPPQPRLPAPSVQTPEASPRYPAPGQQAPASPRAQETVRDVGGAAAQPLEVRQDEMPSVVCPYCRSRVFVTGTGR